MNLLRFVRVWWKRGNMDGSETHPYDDGVENPRHGGYKKARGILSWLGDEPAEKMIRDLRDGVTGAPADDETQ